MVWSLPHNHSSAHHQAGQFLLELLIAMAILGLLLPVLVGGLVIGREGVPQQKKREAARLLLSSTNDSLRIIRENSWQAIATLSGTFHPAPSGNTWVLTSGTDLQDGLSRQVMIEPVNRNSTGAIVQTGGSLDPSTKKVTTHISWTQPDLGELETVQYLTRYLDNVSYTHTTVADFTGVTPNLGILSGTAITNSEGGPNGGEVILGSGGNGNWCLPQDYIVATYDLPQDGRAAVVKAVEGKVFSGTDYGTQGKFVELGVSNDKPPVISLEGQTNGYNTQDIFIDNNYAYIATDNTSKDIVIVDLSTNQEVGYYNDTFWWGTAQGVYVKGNVGYAVIGPKLHTFDLSSKTGSRPELDSVALSSTIWPATGYRLMVVGDYAFVAIDWGSAEMRIINVTNPNNIFRAGQADVNSERGMDIFVNPTGTRAYLVTAKSSSKKELFIIDTATKTGSRPSVGSYEANGLDPKGISLVTENKLLLVGVGAEEYQVINVANEANPTRCGGLNLDTGVYGVAGVLESDGDAYSYILTKETTSELKVLLGGAGETFASSGTYESPIFDAGYTTAFNYISSGITLPPNTTGSYQVAGADPVSGTCTSATYSYVGPDGTSGSFMNTESAIPFNDDSVGYENPARCFRYKVYLESTDQTSTPVFENVQINYSP